MRVGILAAVVLSSTIGLMPSAVAQMTAQENEGRPPPSVTGALGYVVKPRLASDLLVAMREALEGRSFVSPSV